MLEKLVHRQLSDYLERNNLLSCSQFGFRGKRSTQHAVTLFTEHIRNNMDQSRCTGALFMDLRKAFDTVHHGTLLDKLSCYGIQNTELAWFEDYLLNRKQFVCYDQSTSQPEQMTYGVPQGSILGPLLFIILINDVHLVLDKCKILMYADDSVIFFSERSVAAVEEVLNQEANLVCKWFTNNNLILNLKKGKTELVIYGTSQKLAKQPSCNVSLHGTPINQATSNISEWMRVNKLSANPQKTDYMIIGHPRRTNKVEISQPLHLNDSEIKRVTKTKSLGVMVDEGLNWDDQFNKVRGKINGGLKSLKNLKNLIPQSQLDHVYRAVIESHLRYANVIWGSLPKSKLNTLQRLQDRARSIIGKARLKDNWSHNWLTVEQLTKFDRSVMTYKIISKQCPESLWHKYDHRTQHSNYRTRNCRDLQIPRNNLEYVKKGFHYSALKAWNEIPINIRELPTLSKFKKQLKSYYTC